MRQTTAYRVSGMSCGRCEQRVRAQLGALTAVRSATVGRRTGQLLVDGPANRDAVRRAVTVAGYELADDPQV